MSIELIKTIGLRSLGILLILAGGAILVPSLGATAKHSWEQEVASHAQPACQRAEARPDDCRRPARAKSLAIQPMATISP